MSSHFLVACCALLAPQFPTLEATLTAPTPTADEHFGVAVDLDGGWAVCSSEATVQGIAGVGRVHVYREVGGAWVLDAVLQPPDPNLDRAFGRFGLEVEGDFIYVGTPSGWRDTSLTGSVHVYQRGASGWQHVAKLEASQPVDALHFGDGVAVQGDTVAIVSSYPLALYVYERQGLQWNEQARMTPFGVSLRTIDLDHDRIVVGTMGNGILPGAAYVYRRQGTAWSLEATLTSGNPNPVRWFGQSVAIDGLTIACGAVERGATPSADMGEVSIFELGPAGWSEVTRLQSPTAPPHVGFGYRVDLQDDRLLVSAHTYRPAAPPYTTGAMWQFQRVGSSWAQSTSLGPLPSSSPTSDVYFGYCLDSSLGRVIGGGIEATVAGAAGAGLVHIHEIREHFESFCEFAPSSCLGHVAGAGSPSASLSTPFSLTVAPLQGQRSALLFYGVGGRIALPWGSGGGSLCVRAPLQRTDTQLTGGTLGACDGSLVLDWNAYHAAHPNALGQPWSAGDHIAVQAWARNPSASSSTALSDTLEFLLEP